MGNADKPGIQIKVIDGRIGIQISHIVLMLSVEDAKNIGHDLIVTASELEAKDDDITSDVLSDLLSLVCVDVHPDTIDTWTQGQDKF